MRNFMKFRAPVLGGALCGIVCWTGSAVAQNIQMAAAAPGPQASIECPTTPVAVRLTNGATIVWGIRDGNACRRELRLPSGEVTRQLWYGPTFATDANASDAFAKQVKPWALWPLTVGKVVQGRYDGASADPGFTGSWLYKITVDEHKLYKTDAGTFDVFVVTREEQALGGSFKSKLREWYSPQLRASIQTAYSDNNGTSSAQRAISISR